MPIISLILLGAGVLVLFAGALLIARLASQLPIKALRQEQNAARDARDLGRGLERITHLRVGRELFLK